MDSTYETSLEYAAGARACGSMAMAAHGLVMAHLPLLRCPLKLRRQPMKATRARTRGLLIFWIVCFAS